MSILPKGISQSDGRDWISVVDSESRKDKLIRLQDIPGVAVKFKSYSDFPSAIDFGVGILQAKDTGQQYVSNGSIILPLNNVPVAFSGFNRSFGGVGVSTFADRTWVAQRTARGPFYAIQIVLENWDTANALPILAACCAAVPTDGHNGVGLTWTPITFSGAAGGTIAVATGSGNGKIPGLMPSDTIPIADTARTDNPTSNPLIQVRIRTGGGVTWFTLNTNGVVTGTGAFNAITGRADKNAKAGSGIDGTTAPGGVAIVPTDVDFFNPLASIKFYYTQATVEVPHCGDSTLQGQGGTNFVCWPEIGASLASNSSIYYETPNHSIANRNQTEAYNYAVANLFGPLKSKYLLWQGWSVNNPRTTAGITASKRQTIEIMRLCNANGVIPLLTTDPIRKGFTSADRDLINAQNGWIKSLGAPVFDVASYMQNNAGTELKSEFNLDDTHWNVAGQQYLGVNYAGFLSGLR